MDELPRHAKAVLSLARDAHDPPDPAARERVRAKLAAALLVSPAAVVAARTAHAAHVATAKAVGASFFGSAKVWITGAVLAVAAGGGGWVAVSSPKHEARPAQAAAPASTAESGPAGAQGPVITPMEEPAEAAAPSPTFEAQQPVEPHLAVMPKPARRQVSTQRSAHTSLAEETALLARAADRLSAHKVREALSLLDEHRQRFEHSQLVEEREGLRVMAHCLQHPASTQAEARAFIARSPTSVLVARVARACDL